MWFKFLQQLTWYGKYMVIVYGASIMYIWILNLLHWFLLNSLASCTRTVYFMYGMIASCMANIFFLHHLWLLSSYSFALSAVYYQQRFRIILPYVWQVKDIVTEWVLSWCCRWCQYINFLPQPMAYYWEPYIPAF